MNDLDEAYKRLTSWSKSVVLEAESARAQVDNAFDPSTKLPDGCPSRAAMAELILRGLGQKIDEVVAAFDDVKKAVAKRHP